MQNEENKPTEENQLTKVVSLLVEIIKEDKTLRRRDAKRSRIGGYTALIGTLLAASMTGLITINLYQSSKKNNFYFYQAKRVSEVMSRQVAIRDEINDTMVAIRLYKDILEKYGQSISSYERNQYKIKERAAQFKLVKDELRVISYFPNSLRKKMLNYLSIIGKHDNEPDLKSITDSDLQNWTGRLNQTIIKSVCNNQVIYNQYISKVLKRPILDLYTCNPSYLLNIHIKFHTKK